MYLYVYIFAYIRIIYAYVYIYVYNIYVYVYVYVYVCRCVIQACMRGGCCLCFVSSLASFVLFYQSCLPLVYFIISIVSASASAVFSLCK
jgi:hypothetical protein